jgi:tRNA (mo5U34)-methyltransferase
VWSTDRIARDEYVWKCRQRGIELAPLHRVPNAWNPGSLPGKAGFDLAHRLLDSNVEQLVADFMTVDQTDLGSFDVVFFLGVLYHLQDPMGALKRLVLFTREVAIIETAATYFPGLEHLGMFEFYEKDELCEDNSNWWAPNRLGLIKACRAAGFREVEVVSPYPPEAKVSAEGVDRYRLTVHAYV